ncbi:MAG: TIGR04372 family glycosyltransferase [Ignavibacteriales bacterium]|nr:TIGR04372 family glycosyltransferase [Ignavibacteriales bacterium]
MSILTFIQRQIFDLQQGGHAELFRKMKIALRILSKSLLYFFLGILSIPAMLAIRLIRPWLLVRWGGLISSRIGHFAANTELYFCERDANINKPMQRYVDIFYMAHKPICNQQLASMWERVLRVWPTWIIAPIAQVNRLIPGGLIHEIGSNTQFDRDVHNLLNRFPPHLKFTSEEETRGEAYLRAMGIPTESPFVCLTIRDSSYLNINQPGDWSYHNYRDSNVQNFVLAAEELAKRGYFVIRMGAIVHETLKSAHPQVIDYATNGMRSEFLDIYLGANCDFCISVGTGFDAIPYIFRRPIVYVNFVPLGYLGTYVKQALCIPKHHILKNDDRELTLSEIFTRGVGFSLFTSDFESKGIQLIENTPEEIRDVVIEMAERLNGTWQPDENDESLQKRFWDIFPTEVVDPSNRRPLHGEIRSRFGAHFLRNNREFLK